MTNDIKWEDYTFTLDKGTELKIDSESPSAEECTRMIMDFFENAEREAIKNGIETNTIILSPKYNATKEFFLALSPHRVYQYPPMLLGKAVILADMFPDDVAFALTKTNVEIEPDYRALLKKYVKTDGKSLRFKNISYKKNKKDFERIKEILEYDL